VALAAALIPWQSTDLGPRFSDRAGPYLGEKPPGLTPAVFAPGLVTSMRAKAVFGEGGTIHGAARAGDLAAVRALIEQDAKPPLARDEAGRTPLHVAAGSGRADVAAYLIARGADGAGEMLTCTGRSSSATWRSS
jgi:hypothetical protein